LTITRAPALAVAQIGPAPELARPKAPLTVQQIQGGINGPDDLPFPRNSPLRKQVNVALLALREDGTYQQRYDKWFASR
jgi:ABC-type amino acid transport substrate-binding protein